MTYNLLVGRQTLLNLKLNQTSNSGVLRNPITGGETWVWATQVSQGGPGVGPRWDVGVKTTAVKHRLKSVSTSLWCKLLPAVYADAFERNLSAVRLNTKHPRPIMV